jgi:hypothetical protein
MHRGKRLLEAAAALCVLLSGNACVPNDRVHAAERSQNHGSRPCQTSVIVRHNMEIRQQLALLHRVTDVPPGAFPTFVPSCDSNLIRTSQ